QPVTALDRADSGGTQQLCGSSRQVSRPLVIQAQPLPIVRGLLKVVADDLLVFTQPIAGGPLLEVGEALVELRPFALGQRRIRGVADENVPEAISVLKVG